MSNQKSKSKPADSEQRSGKGLSVQRLVRLDPSACVLRPWRIKDEAPLNFTGAKFARGVVAVQLYLKRMDAFGYIIGRDLRTSDYMVDVLDDEGDILDTFAITKSGFEWCRRKLRAIIDA